MISIGANGKRISYGIKHYNLDTEEDLKNLPVNADTMGCTAFIISTSKYYMLNSSMVWVEIRPFGTASNPTPDDDDIIYDGDVIVPDDQEDPDDVIYDGGEV